MDPSQVLIRPVVSEKSYVLAAVDKYTFRVHPDAHKTQIRQAVEVMFPDVKVIDVRTMSVKSKPKRRGLVHGRTRSWKKAVVEVRPGDSLWRLSQRRSPALASTQDVARLVEHTYRANRRVIGPDPDLIRSNLLA